MSVCISAVWAYLFFVQINGFLFPTENKALGHMWVALGAGNH